MKHTLLCLIYAQPQPGTIYLGIEFETGEAGTARIKRVVPNSPAERARLDAGDVLLAMDETFRATPHQTQLKNSWLSVKEGARQGK